jgi:hypothetical protein
MGIWESVILAAPIAYCVNRLTAGVRPWQVLRRLRPLKRKVRQQEGAPRGR